MNPLALNKARSRLRVAKKALEDLKQCKDIDAFNDAWYTFLTASKNIYTVLEQGAKSSAQSRQWFGGKKQERRDDPLLQYIYQARNDDEHGLAPITEKVPQSLSVGRNRPGLSSAIRVSGTIGVGGTLQVTNLDPENPLLIVHTPEHIGLIRVHDRSNNPYDPPKVHLGKLLDDTRPLSVGGLMLVYLETLIREAEGLT